MKLLNKFIVVILALILVGSAGVLVFTYLNARSDSRSNAASYQSRVAQNTLELLDRYFDERQDDIDALVNRQEYINASAGSKNDTDGQAVALKSMNQFKAVQPSWLSFAILDTKSQIRSSTESEADWLADAGVSNLYLQALDGTAVHSDVRMDAVHKMPVVTFMAPLKQGDKITGVFIGTVNWSSALDVLRKADGLQLHLFTKDGMLLGSNVKGTDAEILKANYHAKKGYEQLLKGKSGTVVMPELGGSGRDMLVAYASEQEGLHFVPSSWLLTAGAALDTVYASATQQTLSLGVVIMLALIIAVGVILWMLRREVTQPLQTLNAAINRISLGDLSQAVPPLPRGEVGALGRNFNEMVRQLTNTHRSLYQTTQVAAEGRAQLEASINGLRQGFILTDAKGKLIMTNDAARSVLHEVGGQTSARAASLSAAELDKLLPSDAHILDDIKHTLEKRQQSKHTNLAIGGRFFNLYLSPVVSKDKAIGCVLLLEDVTEERILQRSRDEFFSIASHELRTPLTAIRGNTAIMQEYFAEALKDPAMKEMVVDIHESATRLIEIVNDFLDASRLEQNKMQFELQPFKIESVIERVIYEMAGLSRDKGVAINYDQYTLGNLPAVYADQNRVKQILYNLIGNALKFTEKGNVTINCLVENKKLKVCVTDTGRGISPEGQQLLFRKFQQTGESLFTRDTTRGTGLGLYISKLLLEHMDGQIKLEHSVVDKGTTFSFTVPIATKEQIAAGQPADPTKTAAPTGILARPASHHSKSKEK